MLAQTNVCKQAARSNMPRLSHTHCIDMTVAAGQMLVPHATYFFRTFRSGPLHVARVWLRCMLASLPLKRSCARCFSRFCCRRRRSVGRRRGLHCLLQWGGGAFGVVKSAHHPPHPAVLLHHLHGQAGEKADKRVGELQQAQPCFPRASRVASLHPQMQRPAAAFASTRLASRLPRQQRNRNP
jgi:hypothetical protein